jgi:hypothetical protein
LKRRIALIGLLGLAVMLLSCGIFGSSGGGIEFPPVGYLVISYNTSQTVVDPITLLAEGGAPHGGYTWSLASGSQYPSGTTVDPLTGVFHATGGPVSLQATSFKMTATAGSNSATSKSYVVKVMNYGSGPVPTAVLQQWDPYGVDPSALELADAKAGKGYGASLFVLGGKPPYHWAEDLTYVGRTDLSSVGLTLGPTTGVVWGEPFSSASGKTVRFRVIVTDADSDIAVYQPVYTIHVE